MAMSQVFFASVTKDFRVFSIFRAINFKTISSLFFVLDISQVWFAILFLEISQELISLKATVFELKCFPILKKPGTTVAFSKYWTAKLLAKKKTFSHVKKSVHKAVACLMVLFIVLFKPSLQMKYYIQSYHSEKSSRCAFPCSNIYYDLQGSAKC